MRERRTHPRRKAVLPVKVTAGGMTQLAHTVDIACAGARLGGLRVALQAGETVSLQRGSEKARCRIAWVRELSPNEIQVGLESLDPQPGFLGLHIPGSEDEVETEAEMVVTLPTTNSRSASSRKG